MPRGSADRTAAVGGAALVVDAAQRRRILVATCVALMAVVASASGLNVAQQDLALDLDASQSGVLWIVNAYVVAREAGGAGRATPSSPAADSTPAHSPARAQVPAA